MCYGVLTNDSNVCSGSGRCIDYNTCLCDYDKTGKICETEFQLEILSSKEIFITKSQLPLVIKKFGYSTSSVTYTWNLTEGYDNIEYVLDKYNNLVITNIIGYGSFNYVFKLIGMVNHKHELYYKSQHLKVHAMEEPLQLNIGATDLIVNKAENFIMDCFLIDPDNTKDPIEYSWTCNGTTYNTSTLSISPYTLNVGTYEVSLTVKKGSRLATAKRTIKVIDTSDDIVINLLNVSPATSYINKGQVLSMQIEVSNTDNSSRIWKLNENNDIPNEWYSMLGTPLYESNLLIIDTSYLEEGKNYTFSVTAGNSAKTSTFQYTISVTGKLIENCDCNVSPTVGYALETEFTIYCNLYCKIPVDDIPNTLQYGFIDAITNLKIDISPYSYQNLYFNYNYTTILPLPFSGNELILYVDIVNPITKRIYFTKYLSVTLSIPSNITKTHNYLIGKLDNYFSNGDGLNAVYLVTILSTSFDRINGNDFTLNNKCKSNCNNNGICDYLNSKCICDYGYYKFDCSVGYLEFNKLVDMKYIFLKKYFDSLLLRNEYEQNYLLNLELYGVNYILNNYDELNETSITTSYSIYNLLLKYSNNHLKRKYEVYFTNIYNILHKVLNTTTYKYKHELYLSLKYIFKLISYNLITGSKPLQLTTSFATLVGNKFKNNKEFTIINNNATFTIPYLHNTINNELVYQLINLKDIDYLNVTTKYNNNTQSTYTSMKFVSNFIDFTILNTELKDLKSPLIFTIPLNDISINYTHHLSCRYYSEIDNVWIKDDTCNTTNVSFQSVTCQCSHATIFAITEDFSTNISIIQSLFTIQQIIILMLLGILLLILVLSSITFAIIGFIYFFRKGASASIATEVHVAKYLKMNNTNTSVNSSQSSDRTFLIDGEDIFV
ncbi:hypothetical protein ABK040_014254 [Willaertia magna]